MVFGLVVVGIGCGSAPLPTSRLVRSEQRASNSWTYAAQVTVDGESRLVLQVSRSRRCRRIDIWEVPIGTRGQTREEVHPTGDPGSPCHEEIAAGGAVVVRGDAGDVVTATLDEQGGAALAIPAPAVLEAGAPFHLVVDGQDAGELSALNTWYAALVDGARRREAAERRQAALVEGNAEVEGGRCLPENSRAFTSGLDWIGQRANLIDGGSVVFTHLAHRVTVLGEDEEVFHLARGTSRGTYHVFAVGSYLRPELNVQTSSGLTATRESEFVGLFQQQHPELNAMASRAVLAGGDEMTVRVRGRGCTLLVAYQHVDLRSPY